MTQEQIHELETKLWENNRHRFERTATASIFYFFLPPYENPTQKK